MTIISYLNGRSFDPETLKCMGQAYDAACKRLGLAEGSDPYTRMVAERVIIFVQRGDSDPAALCERVMRTL